MTDRLEHSTKADTEKLILELLCDELNYDLVKVVNFLTSPNDKLGNNQPIRMIATNRHEKLYEVLKEKGIKEFLR